MIASKNAVITGASSGIGRALALEAARRGYHVAVCARNMEPLKALQKEIQSYNQQCFVFQADISNESECKAFLQFALQKLNAIHLLINNAGMSMRASFLETRAGVLEQVMQTNFWGAVYCTRYALPSIIQNQGSIVAMSSVAGFAGLPGRTGYSASKFAMHGFFEALRTELLALPVHILIVCPGFTESNIRKKALNYQGKEQEESPRAETKMMTAQEVAIRTFNALNKRKKRVVFTLQGKLSYLVNRFFPTWATRLTYKHLKKEPDAPF